MAYRPTSLDFINRPNPVEPHTDPHKHPLHAEQNHLRRLHDTASNNVPNISAGEPPRKRRKSGGALAGELSRPTLPEVRPQGEKRLRIPPTLSGLHHPPPDAGILPSISTNGLRSVELPERAASAVAPPLERTIVTEARQEPPATDPEQLPTIQTATQEEAAKNVVSPSANKASKSRKNNKWSESETESLLKGVEKHGIGNWTRILKDVEFDFNVRRSALDLKDRFRICCPDHYKTTRKQQTRPPLSGDNSTEKQKRNRTTHRKTQAELREIGIEPDFAQSRRRKRTAYSEAEDTAILRGFRRYGKKWSQMQQDENLGLESRTAMDLKDRMRTRWPDEYAKAGLKLRADRDAGEKRLPTPAGKQQVGKGSRQGETQAQKDVPHGVHHSRVGKPATTGPKVAREDLRDAAATIKKANGPFLHRADDVFWSQPLETDDEPVTLDRRILDWPLESSRITTSNAIDSVTALHLPRPNALPTTQAVSQGQSSVSLSTVTAALPSLATVTASSWPFDFGEQLELPSLLEGFGTLGGEVESMDTRAGGLMMPTLDELLG